MNRTILAVVILSLFALSGCHTSPPCCGCCRPQRDPTPVDTTKVDWPPPAPAAPAEVR